nr:pentatricopeptide repeat-containing protein At1g51965, mitochondrial [Ipomoea trifida]
MVLRRHLRLILSRYQHRGFATKYSGRVVVEADNGRSFAIEVDSPTLQTDVRGYALPRRDLICKVAQILQAPPPSLSSDRFLDLSDYLETLSLSLTPAEASEVLKSLKSPTLALHFFRFCPENIPNFRHDAFTYNRIILILSKSSLPTRLDHIREIVSEMERSGTRGNISTVNLLIGVFGSGEAEVGSELKRCLELVKKWDLRLTCYTYKCLLQAYLRLNDSSKALGVYREIRLRGYKLDIFSYNMLLDALAKEEKVEQAHKVFEDMKKWHCEPDVYTYTIMIRMNGKTGKPNESLVLFQEMLSKGCSPNLIAYNTVIQALSKGRMVDKTLFLFSKMIENNCRPNELTYSFILYALATEGKLHRLDEVVEISERYMNKSIYAYLVRTLSKLGHAGEAHRLFCAMWNFHDKGDRDAYLSMLESLCTAGKVTEAIDLLSKMHEKGIGVAAFDLQDFIDIKILNEGSFNASIRVEFGME